MSRLRQSAKGLSGLERLKPSSLKAATMADLQGLLMNEGGETPALPVKAAALLQLIS